MCPESWKRSGGRLEARAFWAVGSSSTKAWSHDSAYDLGDCQRSDERKTHHDPSPIIADL